MKESVISDTQPEVFQGRGGFVELGHFDKHFVKNKTKKCLAGKKFVVFLPKYFLKKFWMENWTQRQTQSEPFLPKSEHFFWFSKKDKVSLPLHPTQLQVCIWNTIWKIKWIYLALHDIFRSLKFTIKFQ